MAEESKVHDSELTQEDPTFLAVKGYIEDREESKKFLKNLSSAVFATVQKHGKARLRCVGASAVSNGVKAFIHVQNSLKERGIDIVMNADYAKVTFSGGEERNAVEIHITKVTK